MEKITREQFVEQYNGHKRTFIYKDFSGVDLSGLKIPFLDLQGSNLRGVNLSDTDISCSTVQDCDLYGAVMHNTELSGIRGTIKWRK